MSQEVGNLFPLGTSAIVVSKFINQIKENFPTPLSVSFPFSREIFQDIIVYPNRMLEINMLII